MFSHCEFQENKLYVLFRHREGKHKESNVETFLYWKENCCILRPLFIYLGFLSILCLVGFKDQLPIKHHTESNFITINFFFQVEKMQLITLLFYLLPTM